MTAKLSTYIIQTRREFAASDKLRPLVEEVVLPLEWILADPKKSITKGRQARTGEVYARAKPLFSRYLFLKCDGPPDFRTIDELRFSDGSKVATFMTKPDGFEPYILSPIETLMLKTVIPTFPDKLKRLSNEWFKVGQQVRVIDGPFAGMVLTVEHDRGHHHVEGLVSLFGRLTPLKLSHYQLKAA